MTPTNPTHATDDILLYWVASSANASVTPTHSTPTGFTLLGSAVITTGTIRSRISCYWRRATSGSEANQSVTLTPTGSTACHHAAAVQSVQNCPTSGNPYENLQTNQAAGASSIALSRVVSGSDRLSFLAAHHADNVATGVSEDSADAYTSDYATDNATGIDGFTAVFEFGPKATVNDSVTISYASGGTSVGIAGLAFALLPGPAVYNESFTEAVTAADSLANAVTFENSITEALGASQDVAIHTGFPVTASHPYGTTTPVTTAVFNVSAGKRIWVVVSGRGFGGYANIAVSGSSLGAFSLQGGVDSATFGISSAVFYKDAPSGVTSETVTAGRSGFTHSVQCAVYVFDNDSGAAGAAGSDSRDGTSAQAKCTVNAQSMGSMIIGGIGFGAAGPVSPITGNTEDYELNDSSDGSDMCTDRTTNPTTAAGNVDIGITGSTSYWTAYAIEILGAGGGGVADSLFDELIPAGGTVYNETVTESASAADSLADVMTMVNAINEAASAADALAAGLTMDAVVSEAASASDALGVTATYENQISEGVTAADALVDAAIFANAISEGASAADSLFDELIHPGGAIYNETITESVSAADSAAVVMTMNEGLSEATSAADSLAAGLTINKTLTEPVTAADALTVSLTIPVAITEAVSAADALATSLVMVEVITESVTAADSMSIPSDEALWFFLSERSMKSVQAPTGSPPTSPDDGFDLLGVHAFTVTSECEPGQAFTGPVAGQYDLYLYDENVGEWSLVPGLEQVIPAVAAGLNRFTMIFDVQNARGRIAFVTNGIGVTGGNITTYYSPTLRWFSPRKA